MDVETTTYTVNENFFTFKVADSSNAHAARVIECARNNKIINGRKQRVAVLESYWN